MPHRRDGYFHTCRIALTEKDELAFSRALTERFGRIYCFPEHSWATEDVPLAATIGEVPAQDIQICVASDGWEPCVFPWFIGGTLRGYYRRLSPFHFRYCRSFWGHVHPNRKWAFDPPYLKQTELQGYVAHSDPLKDALETFLVDVFRCLAKVGRGRARAGGRVWGHDAIRDALARGSRAMIDGWFRPQKNWTFPADNRYYRDELWDDDPVAIIPYKRGTSEPCLETTASEYNAQRDPRSEFRAKAPVRARNKLGNLRLD